MAETAAHVKGIEYQKVIEIHPDSKYILICNISPGAAKDTDDFIAEMHLRLTEWIQDPNLPLFTIFTDERIQVQLKKVLDRGDSD